MIAKLFDVDKDGILNPTERQNALEAIKNGFENNFIWNIDKGGSQRKIRVLQKRGVFVEAEDFSSVKQTYPDLALTKQNPGFVTLTNLKNYRKETLQEELRKAKEQWDKLNPSSITREYVLNENLIDKPAHTSLSQIKQEKILEARKQLSLKPIITDVNEPREITTNYLQDPKYKTMTQIMNGKKEELLQQLSIKADKDHQSEMQRVKMREDCV